MTRASITSALAAIAAVGALVIVLPIDSSSLERWSLPKELWLEALALAIVVLAPPRARFDGLDAALAASAVIAIASAALAVEPWIGMRHAGLTLAAVVIALALRERDAAHRERARELVLAALGFVAALTLAETFGVVVGLSGYGRAPGATLGQRNVVAHVLALGVPFAWRAWTRSEASSRERLLGAVVLVSSVAAIVATRSRAGWIAVALAVVVTFILSMRDAPLRTTGAAGAVLGAIGITTLARPSLAWSQPHPYRDTLVRLVDASAGSGRGRLVQIEASLGWLPTDPWLGAGPGNWRVVYPALSPPGDPTVLPDTIDPIGRLLTCDVVATLVERGLLGALAAIAVVLTALRVFASQQDRSLAVASVGCLMAALPLILFDTVLEVAAPLAVLVVLATPPADRTPEESNVSRWVQSVGVGIAGMLLLGAVVHRGVELRAAAIADDDADLSDLARAVELDPGAYTARMTLVNALLPRGCEAVRHHLEEAAALRPHDPMPQELLEACTARE